MAETKVKDQLAQANRPTYATDFIRTDIDNVSFMGNAHIDNITTTLLAMGSEIWTNRRRLHVLVSLLEEKGVTSEMIEQHRPSDEQKVAWKDEREVIVERLWAHWAREGEQFSFGNDFVNK